MDSKMVRTTCLFFLGRGSEDGGSVVKRLKSSIQNIEKSSNSRLTLLTTRAPPLDAPVASRLGSVRYIPCIQRPEPCELEVAERRRCASAFVRSPVGTPTCRRALHVQVRVATNYTLFLQSYKLRMFLFTLGLSLVQKISSSLGTNSRDEHLVSKLQRLRWE